MSRPIGLVCVLLTTTGTSATTTKTTTSEAVAVAVPFVIIVILVCSVKLQKTLNQKNSVKNENINLNTISGDDPIEQPQNLSRTDILESADSGVDVEITDLALVTAQKLSGTEWIEEVLKKGTFNPAYNLQTTATSTVTSDTSVPRLLHYNKQHNRRRDSFTLGRKLGGGAFGDVYEGKLKTADSSIIVAIKTVKQDNVDRDILSSFLIELKIVSNLEHHPNLVNFVGACIEEIHVHQLYIILEYCPFGDLKNFLCKYRHEFTKSLKNVPGYLDCEFNQKLLFQWSHSIAKGMEFLSEINTMHGDLAARNILVGENYTAKIADFGLAKRIYYSRGKILNCLFTLYNVFVIQRLSEEGSQFSSLEVDGY